MCGGEADQGGGFSAVNGFAEADGPDFLVIQQETDFFFIKPAFRAGQEGLCLCCGACGAVALDAGVDRRGAIPALQFRFHILKRVQTWQKQTLTLLEGFNDLRPYSFLVDFTYLCMSGQDGMEVCDAQLDRFFDQEIEALFFDRGEEQVFFCGRGRLRFYKVLDERFAVFLAKTGQFSQKFAVTAVKHPERIARLPPEDGSEIMRGSRVQGEGGVRK